MDIPRAGPANFSSLPWYRKLLLFVLFPLVLPGVALAAVIIGGMGLFAVVCNYIGEQRFKRRMRTSGRLLSVAEAKDRIKAASGTLIIEQPALGWGFTRAWWAADDLHSASPYKMPTRDEYHAAAKAMKSTDWDQWCFDNYVGPENGKALLLKVWNGKKLQSRLEAQFPNLDFVTTWSALSHPPKPAAA
jgi:hypothetical protein